jgi:hypothetical protein
LTTAHLDLLAIARESDRKVGQLLCLCRDAPQSGEQKLAGRIE